MQTHSKNIIKKLIRLTIIFIVLLFNFQTVLAYILQTESFAEKYVVSIGVVKKPTPIYKKASAQKSNQLTTLKTDELIMVLQPNETGNTDIWTTKGDLPKWIITFYNNKIAYIQSSALNPTKSKTNLRNMPVTNVGDGISYATVKKTTPYFVEVIHEKEISKSKDKDPIAEIETAIEYIEMGKLSKGTTIPYYELKSNVSDTIKAQTHVLIEYAEKQIYIEKKDIQQIQKTTLEKQVK